MVPNTFSHFLEHQYYISYLKVPRVLLALETRLEGAVRRRVDAEVQRGPLGRRLGLGGELRLDGDQVVADRPVLRRLAAAVLGRRLLGHDPSATHSQIR